MIKKLNRQRQRTFFKPYIDKTSPGLIYTYIHVIYNILYTHTYNRLSQKIKTLKKIKNIKRFDE